MRARAHSGPGGWTPKAEPTLLISESGEEVFIKSNCAVLGAKAAAYVRSFRLYRI